MSLKIMVGPLLGYEQGDFYTVCVLTEPLPVAPELQLSGVAAGPVAFTQVGTAGGLSFWRAEFNLPVPANALNVGYRVLVAGGAIVDRHGRTDWGFYVPGAKESPRLAYASCNGFSSGDLAKNTPEPYRLWQKMHEQHAGTPKTKDRPAQPPQPFALMLMGGDQVYADEIWQSKACPRLKAWGELSEDEQIAAKAGPAIQREIEGFYDWLYTDRWKDEDMSYMLASVPTVMMWDDHDIFDGWGSYPARMLNCEVYQAVFKNARRTFELFQLRGSTRSRLNAGAAHFSLWLRFRSHLILSLDNRSERTLDQIMSPAHWNDVKAWLVAQAPAKGDSLLVMTGVPAVYRSFANVEKYMDATPWHEELEDDLHDHWTAKLHQTERLKLIMVLLNFLEKHPDKCRGVLLSGDVHVGGLGQIWDERRKVGLTQIISSGIVHPPPGMIAWVGITVVTTDNPEQLGDGDAVAEMLTPAGSDRYLRTRNFATLMEGTDAKLWVNWVCEKEKFKPVFAIS